MRVVNSGRLRRVLIAMLPAVLLASLAAQTFAPPPGAPETGAPETTIRYESSIAASSVAASSMEPSGGAVRSGPVTLTFSLYSDPYLGSPLWSERQSVIPDTAGRYGVLLGSVTPLSAALFPTGEQRWLGVQAGEAGELPRVLLASEPYALSASNADRLGGYPASEYLLRSDLASGITPAQDSDAGHRCGAPAAGIGANIVPKASAQGRLVSSAIYESNGRVGIGTTNPGQALEVAGAVKISGAGNGLTFPDGTTQTTASAAPGGTAGSISDEEVQSLMADQSATVGSTPAVSGQAAIIPDNLDSVHSYIGQAGQQMHFRLSRAAPDNNGASNFLITPYLYGMGIEYPGVIEVWSDDFSVHFNHQINGGVIPARFWVGDEIDSGGLFATAYDKGIGGKSYTVLASDRFSHQSHGSLDFQVRNPSDAFNFQWGPYQYEVTRATLATSATATSLALSYGAVQGVLAADSGGSGAVSLGSLSASPVNVVAGGIPQLTIYPDGNLSIGAAGDAAPLAVGPGAPFTVSAAGAVSAASLTTGSIAAAALTVSGALSAANIQTAGIQTAGAVTAASVNAASISTPALSAGAVTASSLAVGGGAPVLAHLSVVATLSFDAFAANSCLTQTLSLPGASDGDSVALGIPNEIASVNGVSWFAWVSAPDTVSVRGCNATANATAAPPPAAVRIELWKH